MRTFSAGHYLINDYIHTHKSNNYFNLFFPYCQKIEAYNMIHLQKKLAE